MRIHKFTFILTSLLSLVFTPANADTVVGKTADEYSVTPTGQFKYEIPIACVTGTGGISPQLTVDYNSSNGMGLFGKGFDLSGISKITRSPRNLFRDGKADIVRFDSNDRFTLDGNRLTIVRTEGTRREYRTESNTFAKIISEGDLSNPARFMVYSKDGTIHEYRPASALLGATAPDLYWLETKVSDTKGNYYTVSYGGNISENEFVPIRIEYTGNDNVGLSPYASVCLTYQNTTKTSAFITGKKVSRSMVIKTIECRYGDNTARKYAFSYDAAHGTPYLAQVAESAGSDDKQPTLFLWNNDGSVNTEYHESCVNLDSKEKHIVTGDFNGDGKTDILVKELASKNGGYRIFLSGGDYFKPVCTGTFIIPDNANPKAETFSEMRSGDFNGDGCDDVIVERKHSDFYAYDLYLSIVDASGAVTLKYEKSIIPYVHMSHTIKIIDVNQDGAADVLIRSVYGSDYFVLVSSSSESGVIPLADQTNELTLPRNDTFQDAPLTGVVMTDFDGDGTSEVLNGYSLYSLSPSGELKYDWTISLGSSYFTVGDFNGDGKTDILTMGNSDKAPDKDWDMNFSIGKYIEGQIPFETHSLTPLFDPRKKTIYVADINGDGYDDLFIVDNKTTNGARKEANIYINEGAGTSFKSYVGPTVYGTDKRGFVFADFNGDGKQDFLCSTYTNDKNRQLDLCLTVSNKNNGLLSDIIDGLGNTTSISYGQLTDNAFMERGRTYTYPVVSASCPWYAVSRISTPDGTGGVHDVEYRYKNLLLHKRGRGALGFEYTKTIDKTTGTTTESTYEIIRPEIVPQLKSTVITVNGVVVNETNYTNTLSYQYHNGQNEVSYSCFPSNTVTRSYEYNSGSLISEKSVSSEYDTFGNMTKSIVTSGDKTVTTINTYKNDEDKWILGRLVKTTVSKSGSGGNFLTSEFDYDDNSGLLVKEIFEPGSAMGYVKTYKHDQFGNITESAEIPNDTRYEKRTTSTEYTADGRFIKKTTNSLGHESCIVADPSLGVETQTTDANGLITRYAHNGFGETTEAVSPLSTTKTHVGWSWKSEDAPENSTYYICTESTGDPAQLEFFDCLGRSLRKVTTGISRKTVYKDVVYNSKGLVIMSSQPYFKGEEAHWDTMEYDEAGRLVHKTTADGNEAYIEYNGLTTTTRDINGNVSAKTVDMNGNMVKSTDYAGNAISYRYDADGNCIEVAGPRTSTYIEYDKYGNRTKLIDPDLGTITYEYNAYGELVRLVSPTDTTEYAYDNLGRLQKEKKSDFTYSYTYDTKWKGSTDAVTCSNGMRKVFTYDSYGRVISEDETVNSKTFTTKTSYNAIGKIDILAYPSGFSVKNNYDANGYLISVTSPSDNGLCFWKVGKDNAAGQMLSETYGENTTIYNDYDAVGRLIRTRLPGTFDRSYEYNRKGSLVKRTDNMRSMTETFSYDNLERIVNVSDTKGHDINIEYDAVGNITSKTGLGKLTYYDTSNRIKSIGKGSYSVPDISEVKYTSFNKIASLTQDFSDDISIKYNKLELSYGIDKSRVFEKITKFNRHRLCGQQTDFCKTRTKYYVGGIYEESEEKDDIRQFDYIYAGGKIVALHEKSSKNGEKCLYLHHDHLESVMAYTDKKGNIIEELSYDAWGRRRNPDTWECYKFSTDTVSAYDSGFSGHEHLDLFDIVNMDGRMYDPVIGRFMTPDPFVQMPDYTQSLNRYSYCVNNPLSLTDPTGYSWIGDFFGAAVGIAVGIETGGAGWGILIGGALGGASSALVSSVINGANLWQTTKGVLSGAFWGAATATMNFDIGYIENIYARIGLHSVSEGSVEAIQGGSFTHGLVMGLVSSSGSAAINRYSTHLTYAERVAVNAVLGGVVSELGGGKFASGAMTAAYAMLFNDLKHLGPTYKQLKKIFNFYNDNNIEKLSGVDFYDYLGGEIAEAAQQNPSYFINTCAARLSYAMNSAGFKIPFIKGQTMCGRDGKNYFLRAADMRKYFIKLWGSPRIVGLPYLIMKNGIVFQNGLKDVTGHVDVFYNEVSGGAAYTYYNDKKNYPNTITETWKYGR